MRGGPNRNGFAPPRISYMTSDPTSRLPRALAALGLGVLATWGTLALNAAPGRPGTHSDGVEYVQAAASLARTGSPEIRVTHWSDPDSVTLLSHYPPGFSAAIAALTIVGGVDPQRSAPLVLAVGAGLTVAILFWIGASLAGVAAGLLAVLMVVTTPALIFLHRLLWSETLFIPVMLLGLWAMVAYPRRPLLHGLLAAAALSVRYAGIAVAGAALVQAWRAGRNGRGRAAGMALSVVPSLVVLLGWSAVVGRGGEVIRSPGVYPGALAQSVDFLVLLVDWLVPWFARRSVVLEFTLVLTVAGGLAVLLFGRGTHRVGRVEDGRLTEGGGTTEDPVRDFEIPLAAFAASYVVVTVLSRVFLDPLIPFDTRIFAPVLTVVTVLVAIRAVTLHRRSGRGARWTLTAALCAWIVAGVVEGAKAGAAVPSLYTWHWNDADPAIRWAVREGAGHPWVYSNEAALLSHLGGRAGKHLLRAHEDRDAFREAFLRRPGPVLILMPDTKATPSGAEIAELVDLRLFMTTRYAELYLPAGTPLLDHADSAMLLAALPRREPPP